VSGFIRNDGEGVTIECQADAATLDRFERRLAGEPPPLARIERIERRMLSAADGQAMADGFHIQASQHAGPPTVGVTPDAAVCPACLAELRDPDERRHGYGLTNCTHCGPRYSIATGIPWDRPNTTMDAFPMCADCAREYGDLADRRYHAQPIACPACGPRVQLLDPSGDLLSGDPYAEAARLLVEGKTVAVKGLGGYHLGCRADSDEAVQALRAAKTREAKPLALLVADLDQARTLVTLTVEGEAALCSPARPIVLAPVRVNAPVAAAVAPGSHRLGLMLPSTPIQILLLDAMAEHGARVPLVMTSGNPSGEPLATGDVEAIDRLKGTCSAFLMHDRPIARPVDDSVLIDHGAGPPMPLRWARGFAPSGLRLPPALCEAPAGIAFGGDLKGGLAIQRPGGEVVLGQHLGDLENARAQANACRVAEDLLALFEVDPAWVASDMHPAYFSSRLAREFAAERGLPLIEVQHHHAHAAAVMAEVGRTEPVLALVADGVGYGEDGSAWGGELLAVDLVGFERLGHLSPLPLPGGDAAARDVTRCGLSLLARTVGPDFDRHPRAKQLVPDAQDRAMLAAMLERDLRCPPSTALGRLFDAFAAWLELCRLNRFEAEAPMALEAAAAGEPARDVWPMDLVRVESLWQLDPVPLATCVLGGLADGVATAELAARIHDSLADGLARLAEAGAQQTGLRTVALSGGVFANARLTRTLEARLVAAGLEVLRHTRVPTTDGGLALGQAAVAAARLVAEHERGPATLNHGTRASGDVGRLGNESRRARRQRVGHDADPNPADVPANAPRKDVFDEPPVAPAALSVSAYSTRSGSPCA
jgi:hydrogenase maturation protein HypF